MAASNWEQITLQDGREARKYPDGSIRNERGHMIEPLPGKHTITQEDASQLSALGREKKRAIMAEAANEAVQRGDFKTKYGGMAFAAEIAYNAQLKSQNIDDPKQIDAGRFVLQETGISERQAQSDGPNPADDPVRALGVLALEYIRTRQQQSAEPTILEQIHETKKDENT